MPDIWMDVDIAIASAPVNIMPLVDATDFITIEAAVVYNQAGLALFWNFTTTAGVTTVTAVTPTTAGVYDWTDFTTSGMYGIEIPASAGGTINNDTEGVGHFTGVATGVLPWRGPKIGFRAAALNNALIDGGDNLDVNIVQWLGTAAATPTTAGVPEVDVTFVSGTAQTANDNGADINLILADTADMQPRVVAIEIDTGTTLQGELDGIQADTEDIQSRLPAALVGGLMDSNVGAISADTGAADNLEAQYDGSGYVDDSAPSTQSQLSGIANVGSAVHKPSNGFTDTISGTIVNAYTDTQALNGTRHTIPGDGADDIDIEYLFNVGSGTPSSATLTGALTSNGDSIQVQGYDYVAAGFVQIGTVAGKNSTANEVDSFDLFVDMVGSGANEGNIRIRFFSTTTLSSSTLYVDQIFVSFSQGVEGYDNGAVWADSNRANTSTEVGIDGVARNTVSTVGAINTLLASTNLHRVEVAPGSSFTFAAGQTDELWTGRDWTVALGGQDITGIFLFGAIVTGVGTSTNGYEFEECDIGAVTLDNDGHFELCDLSGTFTVGQTGTFTFHNCFTLAASVQTIDFGALGATTVHLFGFDGEINFTNMAAGDVVHITGAGQITTTTCTGGTIDHDGFFQYADAGGNITEVQSDIKVAVDATLVDTNELQGDDVPTLIATAQADLDTITGADGVTLATTQGNYAPNTVIPDAAGVAPTAEEINAEVDTAISDAALATAANLATVDANVDTMVAGIITGTAATGTLSTTQCTSSLTGYTDDQLIGRIITFTAGPADGESSDINDYASASGLITFTAMTLASENGNAFKIT